MDKIEFGPAQDLPIDPRLVEQLSQGTIRGIVDALVELITNSDDSYRSLESDGVRPDGGIWVTVVRGDARCKYLEVRDRAAGMSDTQLQKAVVFAGETSGFYTGRHVRGLFGRGLKESIIALGKGEIASINNGSLSVAQLWFDGKSRRRKVQLSKPIPATKERREMYGLTDGDGTTVRITVSNERMACPSFGTLARQLENHYALRDVMQGKDRNVELTASRADGEKGSGTLSESRSLRYEPPKAKLVESKSVELHHFGGEISIRILESTEGPLDQPLYNPYAKAGLLVRTEGAILDNELFRFTYEQAAAYFLGEVVCPGISERVRAGDFGIIDQNRAGIEWTNPYCQAIKAEVERILEPHVQRKRRELNVGKTGEAGSAAKQKVSHLCKLLNQLAKQELEDDMETDHPGILASGRITGLTIIPSFANVPPGGIRVLTVYVPKKDILSLRPDQIVAQLTSDNDMVPFVHEGEDGTVSAVLETQLVLRPHPDHPETYHYGWVEVRGELLGEQATITCQLGELTSATAVVTVAPPKRFGPRRVRPPRKGGMFTDIRPDAREQPHRRVLYDESSGIISICVNFPGIKRILSATLDEIGTPAGSVLCAELVLEAFCNVVARRNFRRAKAIIPTLESAPDSVLNEIQRLHREYGEAVYSALVVRS